MTKLNLSNLNKGCFFYFSRQKSSPSTANQFQRESASITEKAINLPEPEPTIFGLPVRLKIPKINVDAAVLSLGLTSDGAMDIPKGPDDVAWYNLGQRPGEKGSAVMAGHYGTWKNGTGSVFDNLNDLEKGDFIYVEDDQGKTSTFVVSESRSYDPNAEASEVFESSDEKSHLNLITCEGIWSKTAKSYSQRLVIFTDKE